MTVIRELTQADLPEAQRIVRVAFGTFLGAPDPQQFWSDLDYVHGRFGAEHTASFAAENDDGLLVGSNFATRWGSVGFFGPLATRPDLWDAGIGQLLVAAACDQLDAWGVRHAGLFTVAQSAKHVGLYGKFGFYPRFLTAIMAAPADAQPLTSAFSRYSTLPEGQRQEAEDACRELTEEIYPGLDLRGEIRTVAVRALGDTAFLWGPDNRLAGFAVCHWGPGERSRPGLLFCKVRRGAAGARRRGALW